MDSTVNSAEQFVDSDSDLYNNSYDDSDIDSYYETNVQESENWESASADLGYAESVESMMMDMSNLSELIDMSDALSMQNMIELMEDFDESMQDMLEGMGLDELADTMLSVRKDITPEELKEVKIKHRNKEMKDMVKADADYLKFIFDKLQKGGGTSLSQSATIQQPSSTPQMSSASEVSLGIAMSTNQAAMPSIDVLL